MIGYWIHFRATFGDPPQVLDSGMGVLRPKPLTSANDIPELAQAIANHVAVDNRLPAGIKMQVAILGWNRFEDLIQIATKLN